MTARRTFRLAFCLSCVVAAGCASIQGVRVRQADDPDMNHPAAFLVGYWLNPINPLSWLVDRLPIVEAQALPEETDAAAKGFRYYLPKPFLLVRSKANKTEATVLLLPDRTQEYAIHSWTSLGQSRLVLKFFDPDAKDENEKPLKLTQTLTSVNFGLGSAEVAKELADAVGAVAKSTVEQSAAAETKHEEEIATAEKDINTAKAAVETANRTVRDRERDLKEADEDHRAAKQAHDKAVVELANCRKKNPVCDEENALATEEKTLADAELSAGRKRDKAADDLDDAKADLAKEKADLAELRKKRDELKRNTGELPLDVSKQKTGAAKKKPGTGTHDQPPGADEFVPGPALFEIAMGDGHFKLQPVAWGQGKIAVQDAAQLGVVSIGEPPSGTQAGTTLKPLTVNKTAQGKVHVILEFANSLEKTDQLVVKVDDKLVESAERDAESAFKIILSYDAQDYAPLAGKKHSVDVKIGTAQILAAEDVDFPASP